MARKSKAEILEEEERKQQEIQARAQEIVDKMLPGLVATATATIMERTGGLMVGAQQAGGLNLGNLGGLEGILRSVATDFAKIADPKNERRSISPEVAAERASGRDEMMAAIKEAADDVMRTKDDDHPIEPPVYVVTGKCFLLGIKIEPQQENATTHRMEDVEINWLLQPNQYMRPINPSAKKIHAAYLRMISNGADQLPPPPPGAYVLNGKNIRKRRIEQEAEQVGHPLRRADPAMRQRKEIPVLGTLAPPVVETQH